MVEMEWRLSWCWEIMEKSDSLTKKQPLGLAEGLKAGLGFGLYFNDDRQMHLGGKDNGENKKRKKELQAHYLQLY